MSAKPKKFPIGTSNSNKGPCLTKFEQVAAADNGADLAPTAAAMAAADFTALHTHLPAMSAEDQAHPERGTRKSACKTNLPSSTEDEPNWPSPPVVGRC